MSDEDKAGAGKVVHLVSQEGDKYNVDVAVCKMSELVKTMLPEGTDEASLDGRTRPFPLSPKAPPHPTHPTPPQPQTTTAPTRRKSPCPTSRTTSWPRSLSSASTTRTTP